ncbi:spore germination protein [Paenibacillus elgii]|uniref:Spore germination protein n=2 Tax=Paenibacillus elgii TaxID=189691 RepID=A0A2T6FZ74_9BACL|nr:spore germination protein [Paenibacillus elgii]PUA37216.1 spore germination protein [Paenibacillus elgii]
MQFFFRKNKSGMNRLPASQQTGQQEGSKAKSNDNLPLSGLLQADLQELRQQLGYSSDLIVREMMIGPDNEIPCAFVFIAGLTEEQSVFRLMESFYTHSEKNEWGDPRKNAGNIEWILRHFPFAVGDIKLTRHFQAVKSAVLVGHTVLLIEGCNQALSVDTSGGQRRNVTEPTSQTVVRGPQEGFTEALQTNIALIRRKIKSPDIRVETRQIGRVTQTDVSIMFIEGIVDADIIRQVRDRLGQINIDGILESNYIEEFIQDSKYSVFPTVRNSERPDSVAAALLEGRVAILIDGTPYVLIVPAVFAQFMQSAEDYYHRADYGLVRLLRYMALVISLLAPSLYIAITTFHQEMIPTSLLVSLAAQREGIPFPAFIEALMMEVTFEFLREAGIRMPRAVGTSISIVGALVLGSAAVDAGLVSPAMVIIVSITAISGFIFPSFDMGISIRMLRFGYMALGASFGIFGIIVGLIALVLHMCHLSSFGVPYLSPMAPFKLADQKDAIVRVPWWQMYTRPEAMHPRNLYRTPKGNASDPARQDGGEQNQG